MNSRKVPSIAEIHRLLPRESKYYDPFWARFVLYPLSFPISQLALRLGLSANQISYLGVVVILLGTGLMLTGNREFIILGTLLFNFWAVLDCVDGNVARVHRKTSKYGDFVDSIGGYFAVAFVYLGAGVVAENARAFIPDYLKNINFVLVGALASICDLTMRLLQQHFAKVSEQAASAFGLESRLRRLVRNVQITGLLMPVLLIGAITGLLHWIVLFYAALHAFGLAFVVLRMIKMIESEKTEEGQK